MSQSDSQLGQGALGKIPPRSMGLPIVIDNLGFGASTSVYADLINLKTLYPDRIFCGISIYNPDSSNTLYIAMGAAFGSNKVINVPPGSTAAFDNLTFGPGIVDLYTNQKCTNVRALLSATKGAAGSATINYTTPGQPSDAMCVFLNGVVYEFTNNENDGTPAHSAYVQVPISTTAALSWTALKSAINLKEQAAVATINTGSSVLTLTSTYAGTAAATAFAIADGDASAANTTGATFSAANLSSGATNGTIPVVHVW